MIKQATLEDMDRLMELSRAFHQESIYVQIPFDDDTVRTALMQLISIGSVFLNDHGFVAGTLTNLMFNRNVTVAAELAWYCPQGDGRELKEAFERWATAQGAIAVQFSTFNNVYAAKLAKYLTDDGYAPVEIGYIKGLIV